MRLMFDSSPAHLVATFGARFGMTNWNPSYWLKCICGWSVRGVIQFRNDISTHHCNDGHSNKNTNTSAIRSLSLQLQRTYKVCMLSSNHIVSSSKLLEIITLKSNIESDSPHTPDSQTDCLGRIHARACRPFIVANIIWLCACVCVLSFDVDADGDVVVSVVVGGTADFLAIASNITSNDLADTGMHAVKLTKYESPGHKVLADSIATHKHRINNDAARRRVHARNLISPVPDPLTHTHTHRQTVYY